MPNLREIDLEEAINQMAKMVNRDTIRLKPKVLLVYPPYIHKALMILDLIKHPVKKVSGLRKRKRALYWRTTRKH